MKRLKPKEEEKNKLINFLYSSLPRLLSVNCSELQTKKQNFRMKSRLILTVERKRHKYFKKSYLRSKMRLNLVIQQNIIKNLFFDRITYIPIDSKQFVKVCSLLFKNFHFHELLSFSVKIYMFAVLIYASQMYNIIFH